MDQINSSSFFIVKLPPYSSISEHHFLLGCQLFKSKVYLHFRNFIPAELHPGLNFTPDTTSVLSSLSTSRQLYHSLNLYHCPIFGTYESNNRLERYQRLAVSFTGSVLPLPDMSRIPMEKRAGRGRDSKFLTSSLKSHCPTIATYML